MALGHPKEEMEKRLRDKAVQRAKQPARRERGKREEQCQTSPGMAELADPLCQDVSVDHTTGPARIQDTGVDERDVNLRLKLEREAADRRAAISMQAEKNRRKQQERQRKAQADDASQYVWHGGDVERLSLCSSRVASGESSVHVPTSLVAPLNNWLDRI